MLPPIDRRSRALLDWFDARLRDLLPGRYAFGLTGRGPGGKVLQPGTYVLRLRAQSVDAADGTQPSSVDTVFRITD